MHKFHSHFELPTDERYYQFTWGPATFIGLDSCNQSPNGSGLDTNFALTGENEPGGGRAPDWMPGSRQYRWLATTLAAARERSPFIFVFFHHMPFGSGVHSLPPGHGNGKDSQSGYPLRKLDPLFHQYGVDAVFCGHEEMREMAETSRQARRETVFVRQESLMPPGCFTMARPQSAGTMAFSMSPSIRYLVGRIFCVRPFDRPGSIRSGPPTRRFRRWAVITMPRYRTYAMRSNKPSRENTLPRVSRNPNSLSRLIQ